jgi:hypothetical protein
MVLVTLPPQHHHGPPYPPTFPFPLQGDFTLDDDKAKIVDTVLGLWAMVLVSRTGAARHVYEAVMAAPPGVVFPPK